MWTNGPEERLLSWREFRKHISKLSKEEAILETSRLWSQAPISNQYLAADQSVSVYLYGRAALGFQVLDPGAGLGQRIHQVFYWASLHGRVPGEAEDTPAQAEGGAERPDRGTGVAQEQIGFLLGERAAQPMHLAVGLILR